MARSYLVPGWNWFIQDQRLFFGMQDLRRADVSTFQPLNEWWGKDAKRVYLTSSEMRNADAETFCVLNSLYAKDVRNAYTIMGRISGADVSTFAAVGPTEHAFNATNGYAKDAQSVYHTIVGGKPCVIKGADAASFTSRGNGHGTDDSHVYFERKKVPGADPAKWRHIRGPHSHSETNAYILGQRIRGANGNCLESLPILETAEYWSRDDKGYYRWDKLSDPESYWKQFRECYIFRGNVSKVSLKWNTTESLDPTRADSWAIADHGWFFVNCKEWIQKPDLDIVETPQIGVPFRFGEGLYLKLLAQRTWMSEDRIWIFKAVQDCQRVEKRLVLINTKLWWEYSSLDQLNSLQRTIADAGA